MSVLQPRLFHPGPEDRALLPDAPYGRYDEDVQDRARGHLVVRTGAYAAHDIAVTGHIKSQHETGTTGGALMTPERHEFERSIGVGNPIYGEVTHDVRRAGASLYGDVAMHMRRDTRAQTTVSAGDSLSLMFRNREYPFGMPPEEHAPDRPIAVPWSDAVSGRAMPQRGDLKRTGMPDVSGINTPLGRYTYVEAQIQPDSPEGLDIDRHVGRVDFEHLPADQYGGIPQGGSREAHVMAGRQFEARGIPVRHLVPADVTQQRLFSDVRDTYGTSDTHTRWKQWTPPDEG